MFSAKAQSLEAVLWTEYEELRTQIAKPTLIFVHTDWCGFCKIQQRKLQKNTEILELLKNKVYFLELNAEKEYQTINFLGWDYEFIRNGTSGIHELALKLSPRKDQPAYPLWVLLDTHGRIVFRHEGFLTNKELQTIIESQ